MATNYKDILPKISSFFLLIKPILRPYRAHYGRKLFKEIYLDPIKSVLSPFRVHQRKVYSCIGK